MRNLEGLVIGIVLALIAVFIGTIAYREGVEDGKETSAVVSTMPEKYVGTIQDCNRINLLSCLACHQFPAYTVEVQSEIWEE